MKLCSFNLQCDNYKIDFVEKKKEENLYTLLQNDSELYSYFNIPSADKFVMKLSLSAKKYNKITKEIKNTFLLKYLTVIFIIAILSIVFSFYSLNPLRKALILTEEFIKDILHDFNTPLSSLRLNSNMLKHEIGKNSKIVRIEKSVETILALQSNLKAYLTNQSTQKERFSLKDTMEDRVNFISKLYPNITFSIDINDTNIECNKNAFIRIVDNILSNAAKYNKKNGFVNISYKDSKLSIEDSGQGIKNPQKVFDRFYKENDRGIGIGLHIVKKLSDELNLKISIQSQPNKGTTFFLNLQNC